MSDIKKAIKAVFDVREYNKELNTFAAKEYFKKFKDRKEQDGTYHAYETFEAIDESTIRVFYISGAGDMDFRNSFDVTVD